MVRQAVANWLPPEREEQEGALHKLEPVKAFVDGILETDGRAPREQRHTARRIWKRLRGTSAISVGRIDRARICTETQASDQPAEAGGVCTPKLYARPRPSGFVCGAGEAGRRGVFRTLRYDNLASAVKKILRGYQREETERMIAFRSHWGFASEYCRPARGNEKGGVENGASA